MFRISTAHSISTLAHHIAHIVGVCTEEQMSRVDTSGIIASVANKGSRWNRANTGFIGYAMGQPSLTVYVENPIPFTVLGTSPEPTGIRASRLINFGPKAYFRLDGIASVVMPNNKAHGLIAEVALLSACSIRNWSRFATATFTQLRGWYTCHVSASLLGTNRAGVVTATPGLLMPNYTTSYADKH